MIKKKKLLNTGELQSDSTIGLRSKLRFCGETGHIWLHEHRMLLVHADTYALLRRELIETLGMNRARGLIMRMGYASGVSDCELSGVNLEEQNIKETFMAGPLLYTLEGAMKITITKLDLDRKSGRTYVEAICENSWESQAHLRQYGEPSEGVCWNLIGYASGYTSAFMGRPILYKETQCFAQGAKHCYVVGKPVEEWEDASEFKLLTNNESIAEQLLGLQTQAI